MSDPLSASPGLPVSASSDFPRLIEFAFPLKQTSLDSVHEKSVRHGHICTLHIWPARRPLAACRAALIATLLPDPSAQQRPPNMADKEWEDQLRRQRRELCEKIGSTLEKEIEKKKKPDGSTVEREKEVTKGGILHWGREAENADTLEWFRQQIRQAYGGRAPKVLDPFAGGGAIPLEAMRLGCETTATDLNPVACFLLKCTLEYPHKLAGQTQPLPPFILRDREFMQAFLKSKGLSKAQIQRRLEKLSHLEDQMPLAKLDLAEGNLEADLAWHVRAWGRWVVNRARRELATFYPTYADFEPLKKNLRPYEPQQMRLVPPKADGSPDADALNPEFTSDDGRRYTPWGAQVIVNGHEWVERQARAQQVRVTKEGNCFIEGSDYGAVNGLARPTERSRVGPAPGGPGRTLALLGLPVFCPAPGRAAAPGLPIPLFDLATGIQPRLFSTRPRCWRRSFRN